MAHSLPDLPYAKDALAPHISEETLEYHYGKHHAGYVDKLNAMLDGSGFENAGLEDIIREAPAGGLFNNAAQIWNHTFYWHSMSPDGGNDPVGDLAAEIDKAFGSVDDLKSRFTELAAGNFGSGWTWLVKTADGNLDVVNTDDAGNPIREGHTPLITCDVWEHAYYIDYRNARPKYLEAFWGLINWEFANKNLG